jgi:PAS domain S-box-containing protein
MQVKALPTSSPLLYPLMQHFIPIIASDSNLVEIIALMERKWRQSLKSGLFDDDGNCEANYLDELTCVFVVEQSQLLGLLTSDDIAWLTASGKNLAGLTISQVMHKSIPIHQSEAENLDKILQMMCQNSVSYLPIVDDIGQPLGIVTAPKIATALWSALQQTNKDLQQEVRMRISLEEALQAAQKQIVALEEANKNLQREIREQQAALREHAATEAQLLQTTCELQEIFQAFPDTYFRLDREGKILSCHDGQAVHLGSSQEALIGNRVQHCLPADVSSQFQAAIAQVQQTNSLVAIEYSLITPKGEKNFEARLFPSLHKQIIAIIRDITARKWTEQALQLAKAELEIRVEERTTELTKANQLLLQEIVERQRIEAALRYRIEFEKLITGISNHFINLATEEIDNGINQALESIGKFTDIDRSYVFLFNDNGNTIDNTHEWCAKGIEPQSYKLKSISGEIFPWLVAKIKQGESIHLPNIADLPPEAIFEQELLSYQGIKSLICVPILFSNSVIGWLGFESIQHRKTWTVDSIFLLQMVSEMFANALERKRVEEALRLSKERYSRAISAGKVGVWELDIKTNEVYIDPELKAMLGYPDLEINYLDEWMQFVHPDDRQIVTDETRKHLQGLTPAYEIEHRMLHKDGSMRWFLARGTVLKDAKGNLDWMLGSDTDITERKQAEHQIKASLKEKEVLIKEIHHRVKNNLQVISSLLRLQARYIQDEQALEIFRESQNRVRAMALIHETLYQSNDLAKVNFYEYIRKLTNNLLHSYGSPSRRITLKLNIDNSFVRLDTAIPCGLIINELVSNSIKHAFDTKYSGEINVEFHTIIPGTYSLIVADNGIGVPENLELRLSQSLGLRLVWNLVEQLEGTIAVNNQGGTEFRINFLECN